MLHCLIPPPTIWVPFNDPLKPIFFAPEKSRLTRAPKKREAGFHPSSLFKAKLDVSFWKSSCEFPINTCAYYLRWLRLSEKSEKKHLPHSKWLRIFLPNFPVCVLLRWKPPVPTTAIFYTSNPQHQKKHPKSTTSRPGMNR